MVYLQHHGVKGMKWGVRRYQNKDGSLTEAGKKRLVRDITSKKKQVGSMRIIWRKTHPIQTAHLANGENQKAMRNLDMQRPNIPPLNKSI